MSIKELWTLVDRGVTSMSKHSLVILIVLLSFLMTGCGTLPILAAGVVPVEQVATPCPPCPLCPTLGGWDVWLTQMHAYVRTNTGPNPRYELIASWHTEGGSWDSMTPEVKAFSWPFSHITGANGAWNMVAIVVDKDWMPVGGRNVLLTWPGSQQPSEDFGLYASPVQIPVDVFPINVDGSEARLTGTDGSTSFYTPAVYNSVRGDLPPYCMGPLDGDMLCAGGMPDGKYISVFGVWKARY